MAAGEIIGCFGLTEPHGGSDPANMKTPARKDGGDWVINGAKMWTTAARAADRPGIVGVGRVGVVEGLCGARGLRRPGGPAVGGVADGARVAGDPADL